MFCSPLPHWTQPRQRNSLPQPGYRKEAAVRKQAPVVCPGHSGLSLQQPIAKEQERHCQVWKERSGAVNMQSERAMDRQIHKYTDGAIKKILALPTITGI